MAGQNREDIYIHAQNSNEPVEFSQVLWPENMCLWAEKFIEFQARSVNHLRAGLKKGYWATERRNLALRGTNRASFFH
jgi:hypothetical protein